MLTHCQSQTFVETESPTEGWIPLKLRGLEKLKLWQRFDYPEDYHGDVMVWHVANCTRPSPNLPATRLADRRAKVWNDPSGFGGRPGRTELVRKSDFERWPKQSYEKIFFC